jgi:glyoxylase-like metal-dependent hydrolase (beta-lactamase superfamily II)
VVIQQSDGVVLVDSGASPGSGRRVVRLIKGITSKPVKAVILTHWHNDHPLGLPAIKAEWPSAQVIASEGTRARMAAGRLVGVPRTASEEYDGKRRAQLEGYKAQFAPHITDTKLDPEVRAGFDGLPSTLDLRVQDAPGAHLVMPDRTFVDRMTLKDDDAPAEALFLGRGNTVGDTVVWLPKQRVLVAGDLVVAPIPYAGGYPREWMAVLERLKAFDFEVLIPGHGLAQRDRRYLDQLIEFIAEARRKGGRLARLKLTDEQVVARVDLKAQRRRFAGGDPWLAYWFDRYAAPMAAQGYREARGEELDS